MSEQWSDVADALESGESDRVNAAISDVEDMALDERAQLFESRFDDLTELYADSDDGYVRQSAVRFLKALSPGLVAAFAVDDDERSTDLDRETVRRQADASSGFLLEAMTDTDGRVRNSAKRALKDVFRTYDALEDEETIAALSAELESMAEEYTGKRRDHLKDVREDAEFAKRSGFGRLIEGFQEEFGDELDLGE